MSQRKNMQHLKQDGLLTSEGTKKVNSVKTPSLLFYKPSPMSNKKIQSQAYSHLDNSYQARQKTEIVCQNHQNISAKFMSILQDDQEVYYCQKCAKLLKDQGFQIMLINPSASNSTQRSKDAFNAVYSKSTQKKKLIHSIESYPYPQRQTQIRDFMKCLFGFKEQLDTHSQQVKDILINSQQFYGQQIQQINQYFEGIVQSLQLQKNKCYNYILLQRQNAQKDIRTVSQKLVQGQKQIQSMVADIEQNLDSVYSISWQNYKLVMDTFNNRIQQVDKLLQQIKSRGVCDVEYRKIQFAGVPESINSLSQIIIQNSYGSVQDIDGSLLLTQGSNSSLQRPKQSRQLSISNIPEKSLFDKLRTENSQDSSINNYQVNQLMFSFDGEAARSLGKQKNINFSKQNYQNQINMQNSPQQWKIKQRSKKLSYANDAKVQRVQGIQEVQQIDMLVVDDINF